MGNNSQIIFTDEQKNYFILVKISNEAASSAWNYEDILAVTGRTTEIPACTSARVGSGQGAHTVCLMNCPPDVASSQISMCESESQVGIDSEDIDAERRQAIAKLIDALPPLDVLRRWARDHRPPQSWFDDDDDDNLL
jgi:hypothetical protein